MVKSDKENSSFNEVVQRYYFPFQMKDVKIEQIHAEICEQQDEKNEPATHILLLGDEDLDPKEFDLALHFEVQNMDAGEERFDLSMILLGHFVATVDPRALDQEIIREFQEKEAFGLLWPYLREAVFNITERMRLGMPPLPILDFRQSIEDQDSLEEEEPE
jgi:preprotein translocase subunit SecB